MSARASGVKRTTLAQQLVRGKVAEATVVGISRAFNINPVAALAYFEPYRDLGKPPIPPTLQELVSQIATVDLLRAVIARTERDAGTGKGTGPPGLSPPPHATSVKNWVDAIDDGELRHRVSTATGIAPQNYSAQLTANRLAPGSGHRHLPGRRRRTRQRTGGHRTGHRSRSRLAARCPAGRPG